MHRAVFFFIRIVVLAAIFSSVSAHYTSAQGIHFNSEITYNYIDSKTKLKNTGETIKSNSYSIEQNYNLNLSKNIYPYLLFNAGTLVEWNNFHSETEGTDSDLEEITLRPNVALRLTNPVYQAGIEYRRTEIHENISGVPDIERFQDEVDTLLGWRPQNLPQVTLRYNLTHSRDDPKTVDVFEKQFQAESNYSPWQDLRLDYNYNRVDTDDRLRDFDTLEQNHFGRIKYSHVFLDGRLSLNSGYSIQYNTFEFPGAAGGTADVSLQRSQGLSSLDNTPQDGPAMAVNAALIDGNLTASAGIDLGTNGNQTTLANIGLDFGIAVDVDKIRIWVDRTLSVVVSDSFSWSVYVSPDNTDLSTWTLVATGIQADFGTFENRFEIIFPTVNTRFIKVVTAALSPLVPGANNFQNIFVTEMQAFVTVTAGQGQDKNTNTNQNVDFGLRAKLTDDTTASYNMNYIVQEQDPFDVKNTQLSNTISLGHIFNTIFSIGARCSRTDISENNEDRVTYSYNASVRGAYLPTFSQTLTFSGDNTKEEDDSSDAYSIILRNNAILYRGWSAYLDSGLNYNRPTSSNEADRSILLRVGTNFEPNQKLSLNLNYRLRRIYEPDKSTRYDFNMDAFFVPTRTISFNASFSFVKRAGAKSQTFQNYVVSWSPSPDGDLQFFLTYTDTLNSETNNEQKAIGPGFNWTISRHFFLETFFNLLKQESDFQKIESNSFFARLRMVF